MTTSLQWATALFVKSTSLLADCEASRDRFQMKISWACDAHEDEVQQAMLCNADVTSGSPCATQALTQLAGYLLISAVDYST